MINLRTISASLVQKCAAVSTSAAPASLTAAVGANSNSSGDDPSKVIVFDWDDTICPSSFVDRWQIDNFKELPIHFQRLFGEIAKAAERCLHEASKHGEVIIITNSDDGWVKFSCERFVPQMLPVIEKYRIVSARTLYERFYPGQPLCWKAAAFAHEVNEVFHIDCKTTGHSTHESSSSTSSSADDDEVMTTSNADKNHRMFHESCPSLAATDVSSVSMSSDDETTPPSTPRATKRQQQQNSTQNNNREIISFGDSIEERTAAKIVADQLSARPKSVMFVQSPNPIQIVGQLQMVTNHMKFVCTNPASLDLVISPGQADRAADAYLRKHLRPHEHRALVDDMRRATATLMAEEAANQHLHHHASAADGGVAMETSSVVSSEDSTTSLTGAVAMATDTRFAASLL